MTVRPALFFNYQDLMKYCLVFGCVFLSAIACGQTIGNVNFNHLYNPQNEVEFQLKVVRTADHIQVLYVFQPRTAEAKPEDYAISWEKRESFNQREGTQLSPAETAAKASAAGKAAWLSFPLPDKPWLLVARVKNTKTNAAWTYVKTIEANYPVNGYLVQGEEIITRSYFTHNTDYTVVGSGSGKDIYGFYYKEDFLPASPPFVESESRVDRFLTYDSAFRVTGGSKLLARKEGLYLFQEDTLSAFGFAARSVRTAFPKYTRVEDLIKPMIYLCTQEENTQLKLAGSDKTKFDRTILEITGDKDRAKNFIRSYFRRVELANQYFSSYKEGWKTDRGMIYIVFGLPNEVIYNGETEVWRYKNLDATFTFVKTGSIYGPEYFVLVRDKRFAEMWYTTIDLWRKARY